MNTHSDAPKLAARLLAGFFLIATCILVSVGVGLLWPGTIFDAIWLVRSSRRALLMPYRAWLGPMFLTLAVLGALGSYGSFAGRVWAWRLALAALAANGLGDLVQLAMGRVLEGGVGVTIAGALIFWLTRPQVRVAFS